MSFDLYANNPAVPFLTVNQSAWPPIWYWLCSEAGNLVPSDTLLKGTQNAGTWVSGPLAEHFAHIIERAGPSGGPDQLRETARSLAEGTRAERLIRFFRTCGGFTIR